MRASGWLIGMLMGTGLACAQGAVGERTVPADPNAEISVSSVSGAVEVSGWDRAEVAVSSSEPNAVTMDGSGRHVSIRLRPGMFNGKNVTLRVRVPSGSSLDLSAVSADVTVHGVTGAQWLRTVSGNLTADLAPADMEVKTISGDLTLRGERSGAHLRISDVSGDVNIQGVSGGLEANGTSGTLRVSLHDAHDVRIRTTSGEITLTGSLAPHASVDGETVSGGLSLQATPADGYQYEVSSFSGRIENCFGQQPVHTSQYAPGTRLEGTRGAGGGQVRLRTLSGKVTICDR